MAKARAEKRLEDKPFHLRKVLRNIPNSVSPARM